MRASKVEPEEISWRGMGVCTSQSIKGQMVSGSAILKRGTVGGDEGVDDTVLGEVKRTASWECVERAEAIRIAMPSAELGNCLRSDLDREYRMHFRQGETRDETLAGECIPNGVPSSE